MHLWINRVNLKINLQNEGLEVKVPVVGNYFIWIAFGICITSLELKDIYIYIYNLPLGLIEQSKDGGVAPVLKIWIKSNTVIIWNMETANSCFFKPIISLPIYVWTYQSRQAECSQICFWAKNTGFAKNINFALVLLEQRTIMMSYSII